MKSVTLLVGGVVLLFIQSHSYAAGTDVRQAKQGTRIMGGVASGELTGHETKRLVGEQRHIARTENRFKSDGVYTAKERLIVNHKQNKASHRIFHQKHDGEVR